MLSVSFSKIRLGRCAQFSCNLAKGLFPKERRAKQNNERSRGESDDYCLEINVGVRSCDGSVNSNKSPVLMFVLMTAEADLSRVKVRANCLESQCF